MSGVAAGRASEGIEASAEFRTVPTMVAAARARLAGPVWDYLTGGSETEATLRRNRAALDAIGFCPRVLRDVRHVSAGRTFLGKTFSMPVCLAPIGSLRLFAPEAAVASARAAAEANIPCFVSIMAQPALEEVAASAPGAFLVLQIYMRGDRDWLGRTLSRAEEAGVRAICLTVDAPVYGRRERDIENGFSSASAVDRVNFGDRHAVQITPEQAGLTWETVAWLRRRTALPIILKGVLAAEDAALAVEHGVDVVYLSNHGGRQLDHCCSPLDQLSEVAAATAGRSSLVVDGGFMRGTDVLKACALGADLVGLGKAQGLALAAGGQAGLLRYLAILKEEIETSLALLGCSDLSRLSKAHLRSTASAGTHLAGGLADHTVGHSLGLKRAPEFRAR